MDVSERSDLNAKVRQLVVHFKVDIDKVLKDFGKQLVSPDDVYGLADICLSKVLDHEDYEKYSSVLLSYALEIENEGLMFHEFVQYIYNKGIASKELLQSSQIYKQQIDEMIDHTRDTKLDSFGIHTMKRSYLYEKERPQFLWMRVALGIHGNDIDKAMKVYDDLSNLRYTHATPTLFNAGTKNSQMSSCFLIGMKDSISGIFKTITDIANISKFAGGIGVHLHEVRSKGSLIKGTYGKSDGIIPLCRVLNEVGRYVNQGGRRKGSIAIYIEPWHADIEDFCELRKPMGDEQRRCRDLFMGLWVNNLFMKCVENDELWYLFSPDDAYQLINSYGEQFNLEYMKLVQMKKYKKEIRARDLWRKILISQIETGMPYMAYKDNVNEKNNQSNLGTIRSSNLCCEIMQYSDHKHYSVCNLASLALPSFVREETKNFANKTITIEISKNSSNFQLLQTFISSMNLTEQCEFLTSDNQEPILIYDGFKLTTMQEIMKFLDTQTYFDFTALDDATRTLVHNLNRIIDINFYPVPETKLSNMKMRPIGIGVQGLSDTYIKMNMCFDQPEAMTLNKQIFECIYYAALDESCNIARDREMVLNAIKHSNDRVFEDLPEFYDDSVTFNDKNFNDVYHKLRLNKKEVERDEMIGTYECYNGCPMHNGKLQFDLWDKQASCRLDWSNLRDKIKRYGVRNSLMTSIMPTASTSQLLGNNECVEPITSNLYTRNTLSGDHVILNKYLRKKLRSLHLWNDKMIDQLIQNDGSIQNIHSIPEFIRKMFRTAFELPQKSLVQQSIDRGCFIDQSQSLNLFMIEPDFNKLSSCHFWGWKNGLKTGMYYLRSKPAASAIKYGNQNTTKTDEETTNECTLCTS